MVPFDKTDVFIADVVTLPEYAEVLVFTVLESRVGLCSVDVLPKKKVDFAINSEGDVILDVPSTDKGVTLIVSATTGCSVYNVVRNSVVFRTVYEGYFVVETVLNVFFNSSEAGEA